MDDKARKLARALVDAVAGDEHLGGQLARMIEMRVAGASYTRIAAATGLSKSWVHQRLTGLERRLLAAGLTLGDLAV